MRYSTTCPLTGSGASCSPSAKNVALLSKNSLFLFLKFDGNSIGISQQFRDFDASGEENTVFELFKKEISQISSTTHWKNESSIQFNRLSDIESSP